MLPKTMMKWVVLISYFLCCCHSTHADNVTEVIIGEGGLSLEALCMMLNISSAKCTCEQFKHDDGGIASSLCDFEEEVNQNEKLRKDPQLTEIYASVTVVASGLGIIGNFIVLAMAYNRRNDMSNCEVILAQLALTDLLSAIVQTIAAVPLFWTNKWVLGTFMCKVLNGFMSWSCYVAIGFILLVTVERFFGILHPLTYKGLPKKLRYIPAISVVLAGLFTTIPLFIVNIIDRDNGRCQEKWPIDSSPSLAYSWFILFAYSIFPVLVILILYVRITYSLKANLINSRLALREADIIKRIKINRRIMWIIVSILLAFILCIFPNRIIWLYLGYMIDNIDKDTHFVLLYISAFSYPFHVTFNPIIYSLIDKQWRKRMFFMVSARLRNREDRKRSRPDTAITLAPNSRPNTQYGSGREDESTSAATFTCNSSSSIYVSEKEDANASSGV